MEKDTSIQDSELLEKALEYYRRNLQAVLEPEHNGEFVTIDVERGLYAVSSDPIDGFDELKAKGSEALLVLLRVGYPWTFQKLQYR